MEAAIEVEKDSNGHEDDGKHDILYFSGCPKGERVIPECEVILENDVDSLESRYSHCVKNPGHANFISVDKFTVDDLPQEHRTKEMVDDIFRRCALTLKIRTSYTSLSRPKTFCDSDAPYPFIQYRGNDRVVRYGTGSVVEVFYYQPVSGKPCPCHLCKKSDQPKSVFWWIRARTATHVIHDRSEAERAELQCFYDSDNAKNVKTIYGFDTFNVITSKSNKMFRNDVCDILCVTHDHQTVAIFNSILPANNFLRPPTFSPKYSPSKVIVSHPHGCSKRITVGNLLHLTVTIGPDQPTNTPIPFTNGTIYRTEVNSSESENTKKAEEKRPVEDINDNLNVSIDSHRCIIKDRLDDIRKTVETMDVLQTKTMIDLTSLPSFNALEMREKYIVEFYLMFLREHCLKILVLAAILDQKCRRDVLSYDHQVAAAFQEVFRNFLGKECHPASTNADNDDEYQELKSPFEYWIGLLRDSEDSFVDFKNKLDGNDGTTENSQTVPSVILAWFYEVEKIMDSVILESKRKQMILNEDILPEAIDRGLKVGMQILGEYELRNKAQCADVSLTRGVTQQEKNKTTGGEISKEKENYTHGMRDTDEEKVKGSQDTDGKQIAKEQGTDSSLREKSEKEKIGMDKGKEQINKEELSQQSVENVEKIKGREDIVEDDETGIRTEEDNTIATGNDTTEEQKVNIIPEGSTYTLPVDAEYAFRVYSETPGWITFPSGTIMTSPDGTQTNIGGSLYGFKHPSIQPQQCYVTYNTNTCPGSSGANVHSDMLGPHLGTYFPHSGHIQGGINRSGIRDNFYTLYSKMFLHSPRNDLRQSAEQKQQQIIERSKSLLQRLKDILKKN